MTTEEKFEAESAEAASETAIVHSDPSWMATAQAEAAAESVAVEVDISDNEARVVEAAPMDSSELRITRAWVRARRALQLAVRAGAPLPSVRMFPDGSAEFIFPGRLAMLLKGNAQDFTACAGNNRLSIASTVAEDADAVSIAVPGDVLGREKD